MQADPTREDIRHFLRSFGIRADERITAYLAGHPGADPLKLRIVLEEVDPRGTGSLRFEHEGEIRRL